MDYFDNGAEPYSTNNCLLLEHEGHQVLPLPLNAVLMFRSHTAKGLWRTSHAVCPLAQLQLLLIVLFQVLA